MFQHYLITRFNLRRQDWISTKNNEKVLSESWLEERFELFENFCFPSVKNQSNQNFKWLVFFDTNTPEKYKRKIEEYTEVFKNFHPFFIEGMKNFLPSIKEKVNKFDAEKYIITSRLDNDDSLHEDYIAVVQSYFKAQDYMAIDVIDGYGMQIGNKVRLGRMRHLYNPYISLIEKKENCKIVWHTGHAYWKYERNVFRVKSKPLWLTIIHKKNKANKFRGFGKVNPTVLKEFNITSSKVTELTEAYEDYNLWRFDSFKNRFYIFLAYYSKKIKRASGFYKIKILFDKSRLD
jgi:hypothetical protein